MAGRYSLKPLALTTTNTLYYCLTLKGISMKAITLLLSALVSLSIFTCHGKTVKEIDFISATPDVRINPRYPIQQARDGQDGWVQLSYVVEANGSVSNVIVENSSGIKGFEKEARKAVKKWKYNPAIENGEPVQSCINTVQLDFSMNSTPSKKYLNLYQETTPLINKDTLIEFKRNLDKLEKLSKNSNETFRTNLLNAQYAQLIGDKALQLKYFEISLSSGGKLLLAPTKLSIYQNLYSLYLHFNHIDKAYGISDKILAMDEAEELHQQYQQHRIEIDSFVAAEQDIAIFVDMKRRTNWGINLVRTEFSITEIDGRLTKLEIRCANKSSAYTIADTVTWKIPSSWQQCRVVVFGEDHTTFKLVEHQTIDDAALTSSTGLTPTTTASPL